MNEYALLVHLYNINLLFIIKNNFLLIKFSKVIALFKICKHHHQTISKFYIKHNTSYKN